MPNVLMIGFSGRGGHGRYCRSLADAIVAEGEDLVLHSQWPMPEGRWFALPGIRHFDRFWRTAANARRSVAAIRRTRPPLLHFQLLTPIVDRWWIPAALRRRAGVITVHNVEPHTKNVAFSPRFMAPILRAMDAVIVHTEANRVRLEALYPEASGRVHVVPHAAWATSARLSKHEARADLGIAGPAPIVLFFGAIRRNKGLGLLLNALKLLSDSGGTCPRLVVAGRPDRDGFGEYEDLIRRLRIDYLVDRRLTFIAEQDVAKFYAACDVVALPYEPSFQAQSGILLDAYSYGRPVVVTDVGGVGMTVREDGTGEVLEERTPAALAAAISRVLDHPEQQAALASRLAYLQATKYSWGEMARRTMAVYEAALLGFAKRAPAENARRDP